MCPRVISTFGSRQGDGTPKSHEITRKRIMVQSRESLSTEIVLVDKHVQSWPKARMHRRSKGTFAEGEPRSGAQASARRKRWPYVTRRRTMLHFREISCGFRVSPRCRDPKDETLRLRSAKVGASMSRPIKAKLKANCADLQAEPQAQRFRREATRQRGEFLCVGRRPGGRSLNTCKARYFAHRKKIEKIFLGQ